MKRGDSGLSLVVALDKPLGLSSHDVVNRCRRIFGERRCGHTGTLDPLATGVLPICVGPATRLDRFMVGHDKRYRVTVSFGCETTTDDAEGEPTVTATVPSFLQDEEFAARFVSGLVGVHQQVPPQYSAVKVAGKKAYEAARHGAQVDLDPRRVEVFSAELIEVSEGPLDELTWKADFHVSKGTYIRALVRDMGRSLTCPAHVGGLARLVAGRISLQHCHSLETLESLGLQAALDPVRVLGTRFGFGDDCERFVNAGNILYPDQLKLYEPLPMDEELNGCACTSGIVPSEDAPAEGELAAVVVENKMKALYRFDLTRSLWKPECVFSTPILRG